MTDRLRDADMKDADCQGRCLQHLFTTDRAPSTLQDQEFFKCDWQMIRNYSYG